MESTTPIYTGAYHFRRWSFLVLGMVMPLGAVWILAMLFRTMPHGAGQWFAGVFVTAIVGFVGWSGARYLHAHLTNATNHLRITEEAVSYGGRCFPWSEIGSLYAVQYHRRLQLLMHGKGRIALDRYLFTDEGLSEEKYHALMQQLRAKVGTRFPDLRLG